MKTFLFLMALALAGFLASEANAQSAIAVDINRAILAWDWAPDANGGVPDEFHVYCGQQSGSYTIVTTVQPGSTRAVPVRQVISGSGSWFCVVRAANTFGESGSTNEVPFVAGAVPSSPSNLRVQAQ